MTARPLTPPPLQGPTAKEKKYDRQLRLWAASGQQALEDAHVLLLNDGSPGVVGVETLKNLILPGIGSYSIVDGNMVAEKDLGINFFLTDQSLGKSRAEETCKYLTELNPDVKGYPVQKSLRDFLGNAMPSDAPDRPSSLADPNTLDKYSLVLFVASKQNYPLLRLVSSYCATKVLPLFYVHSLGLFSHFSTQLPDPFPIVDTHPDPTSTQDLRLLEPWPELQAFAKSKTENLDALSNLDHGHIPYLLLLLRFLTDWRESHDGNPPSEYREKKEFKSFVESKARTDNPEGGEENFDEAAAAILKSLNKPSLPSGLRQVLEDPNSKEPQKDSANFWLVANAIQKFHQTHGALPLPGALPDMKAQSQDYIQLQNIYKAKARYDIEEVTKSVRSTEADLKRHTPVEAKEIESFCKGAAFVKLIKGKPLPLYEPNSKAPQTSLQNILDDEDSLLPIFLAFQAYDHWLQERSNASPENDPATTSEEEKPPLEALKQSATKIIDLNGASSDQKFNTDEIMPKIEPILEEFVRADGAELHNISALTGGMVAQEVIKVLTKQYIPIDNTCVFDGIASKSAVFRI
ncbi:MAG: hypothetical protein L6R38_002199 [Xanthoria sp. 2 TBL-2021]|nr:MAG: hypothetical protein L6R38_002199 [Xanthoria sp. 2 TBL-2021]